LPQIPPPRCNPSAGEPSRDTTAPICRSLILTSDTTTTAKATFITPVSVQLDAGHHRVATVTRDPVMRGCQYGTRNPLVTIDNTRAIDLAFLPSSGLPALSASAHSGPEAATEIACGAPGDLQHENNR
jgi:hypothetical protein